MMKSVIIVVSVALAVMLLRANLHRITVFEFERGLLYVAGRFRSILEPGQYWLWTPSRSITKVDMRPRVRAVPGQEVMTSDGIAVKVSLVAHYQVTDPVLAVNGQADYESALYTELQLAIRHLVASNTIEGVLQGRSGFAEQLTEASRAGASALGLNLQQAAVKDLTLPGELKKLFTHVTKARQEGLAALERARGETAALRSLANAARMVEDNPALMQLRLLQVVGEQSGNTVVLGVPGGASPFPISASRGRVAPPSSAEPKPGEDS